MPKKYRLSGEEIRNLSGKRLHGKLFSMLVAPIKGTGVKCATVASKKVARRAVERNKIKRRCRAALSKRIMNIQKPIALVFYAKSDAKIAKFSAIEADIETLLSKV